MTGDPYALQDDEIIVDSFAGGGGASLGISWALGRGPDIAINHDREAIAMHRANHPETVHLSHDIWKVDPKTATGGRKVGLLWASPDCRGFSVAASGRPRRKNIRDLAWVIVKWAQDVQPRVIALENVEEFQSWSPLDANNMPAMNRKGAIFNQWLNALRCLGYTVEYRILRACDYGAPTTRRRLFLIARRDGAPIRWPLPTHADPADPRVRSGLLKPYRTAAECIDWSLPCPSIFLTKEEGRAVGANRPLAPATMRRTAKGVMKYVVKAKQPFIMPITHLGSDRGRPVNEPVATITSANRGELAVVSPFVTKFHSGSTGQPADAPLATITSNSAQGRPGCAVPLGVVQASLTPSIDRSRAIAAFLGQQNTGMVGHPATAPLSTIVQKGCTQTVVTASLALETPEPTTTAAFVGQHNKRMDGNSATDPLSTIVQKDKHAIVAANLTDFHSSATCGGEGRPDKPLKTITAAGQHAGLIAAFLEKYYGTGQPDDIGTPIDTITAKGRFGLVVVTIANQEYVITDIGLRMLQPKELYAAQGFPTSYRFTHGIDETGKAIVLTKTAQIRMCGNSVVPQCAEAIIAQNLGAHRRRAILTNQAA